MEWPALVINLKQHVIGEKVKGYIIEAGKLALKHRKLLIVCPAVADLDKAFQAVKEFNPDVFKFLRIFSQKIDNVKVGDSRTGSVCLDSLENAQGSLLNHMEARVYGSGSQFSEKDFNALIETIQKAKAREDFALIVCADNALTAQKIARKLNELNLTENIALAVEWDEFIGKRISMVKEKPGEILKAVQAVSLPVYCGAGVESAEDINKARKELKAQGALAATGFTKAPQFGGDFRKAIESVLSAVD